jgi:hypothetical protein
MKSARLSTVKDVEIRYGSCAHGVFRVTVPLYKGELLALRSFDDAGNTSLRRPILGLLAFQWGIAPNRTTTFGTREPFGEAGHARAALRIAHTFKARQILSNFSVEEPPGRWHKCPEGSSAEPDLGRLRRYSRSDEHCPQPKLLVLDKPPGLVAVAFAQSGGTISTQPIRRKVKEFSELKEDK